MSVEARVHYTDRQLEQALLGGIISGEDGAAAAHAALPLLCEDDFGEQGNRAVLAGAQAARAAGGVSPVAVLAALRAAGRLNEAGGEARVEDLPFYGLGLGDPVPLVARLKELARARRLADVAARLAALAAAGVPADRFVEDAQRRLAGALDGSFVGAEFESALEGLERVYAACEARERPTAWETGLARLDYTLGGGLYAGTLNVFAARPGTGKTSLATQVAYTVAAQTRAPCLMFSLEMPPAQIWQRVMAGRAHVPHDAIRQRDTVAAVHHEPMARVVEASRRVPFYLHRRRPGERKPSAGEFAAIARAFRHKHGGLGVLVVDYLQIAVAPGDAPKHERIGDLTSAFKELAIELECAVVGVSQFNRGAANERPEISQLLGSGAIESDADTVVMLYREDPKDPRVQLIVGKNRHGRTGGQTLRFVEDEVRFEEAE